MYEFEQMSVSPCLSQSLLSPWSTGSRSGCQSWARLSRGRRRTQGGMQCKASHLACPSLCRHGYAPGELRLSGGVIWDGGEQVLENIWLGLVCSSTYYIVCSSTYYTWRVTWYNPYQVCTERLLWRFWWIGHLSFFAPEVNMPLGGNICHYSEEEVIYAISLRGNTWHHTKKSYVSLIIQPESEEVIHGMVGELTTELWKSLRFP